MSENNLLSSFKESDDIIRFLSKVFSRHLIPELIVIDNGS